MGRSPGEELARGAPRRVATKLRIFSRRCERPNIAVRRLRRPLQANELFFCSFFGTLVPLYLIYSEGWSFRNRVRGLGRSDF